jgi:hypothetical protein
MTCSNTKPAAVQAFAFAFLGIAAATGPIFYRRPAPFAAAIFPMASAAVRGGRVRALLKNAQRERERAEREAHARRFLPATNVAKANGVP